MDAELVVDVLLNETSNRLKAALAAGLIGASALGAWHKHKQMSAVPPAPSTETNFFKKVTSNPAYGTKQDDWDELEREVDKSKFRGRESMRQ